jgi:hypothetical protein
MTGFLPTEPWQVVRYARSGLRGELEESGGHIVWLAAAPEGTSTEDTRDAREHTETRIVLYGTDPEVDVTGSDRMRGPHDPEGGPPQWRVIGRPDRWRGRGLGGVRITIEEVTG